MYLYNLVHYQTTFETMDLYKLAPLLQIPNSLTKLALILKAS